MLRPEGKPCFLGYVANLSQNGAFVQCSSPRPTGTAFSLKLHLQGKKEAFPCQCEVIWSRGYKGVEGPCPGMGIRFVDLSDDDHDFLERFCTEADAS